LVSALYAVNSALAEIAENCASKTKGNSKPKRLRYRSNFWLGRFARSLNFLNVRFGSFPAIQVTENNLDPVPVFILFGANRFTKGWRRRKSFPFRSNYLPLASAVSTSM